MPRAGDTYILWNIRMPDEYYRLAEEEFAVAVVGYLTKKKYKVTKICPVDMFPFTDHCEVIYHLKVRLLRWLLRQYLRR